MRRGQAGRTAARGWAVAALATIGVATAAGAADLRVQAEMAKVAVAGQPETLTVRLATPAERRWRRRATWR